MRERRGSFVDVALAALEAGPAAGTGARVRRWCRSWLGAGVGLILLCAAVYLPGLLSIPPVDRDESRFAQATRQMVVEGDYIIPRVQDRPRLNKPPLIYWLQAGSLRALGDAVTWAQGPSLGESDIGLYRVPSAVCALLSVLLTWRLGVRMTDPRAAALGAALLAASPMVVWDAHQARADQLLLLTVTGSMLALHVLWTRQRRGRPVGLADVGWGLAMWAWVGLGVMAKGPVTPLVVLLAWGALAVVSRGRGEWGACGGLGRWVVRLNPVVGGLVVALIVGPWVSVVMARVGAPAYLEVVWRETLGRSAEAAEGHWGPPGYHLVLVTVLLWPAALLLAMSVGRVWARAFGGRGTPGRWRLRARSLGPGTFLLAWAVPAWAVFELIATKLPHYVMPMYPALALLAARAAVGLTGRGAAAGGRRAGAVVWGVVGAAGLGGTLVGLSAVGGLGDAVGRESALGVGLSSGVLVGVLVLLAVGSALRGRLVRAHVLGVMAAAAWSVLMLGVLLPRSPAPWVSPRVAQAVELLAGHRAAPVALVGYEEDSMIFLLGGRGERLKAADLPGWLAARPAGVAVIERSNEEAARAAQAAGLDFGARVEGYNYSTGRRVAVDVYAPLSPNPRLR